MTPTLTPPCLGEREAVARTLRKELIARHDYDSTTRPCSWIDGMDECADAIIAQHIEPLRTENETLRAERHAAIARAEEAERRHEGKFWIELREPGRVPERKGEFPIPGMSKILREFMDARPTAFLTVVTIGYTGPDFQHGPEALQMADARSMERGRKHNARVREAHGDHATKTALAERDALAAKLAQAEGEIATMRERAAKVADDWIAVFGARDPKHVSTQTWACDAVRDIAEAIRALPLTTPEPPHGD